MPENPYERPRLAVGGSLAEATASTLQIMCLPAEDTVENDRTLDGFLGQTSQTQLPAACLGDEQYQQGFPALPGLEQICLRDDFETEKERIRKQRILKCEQEPAEVPGACIGGVGPPCDLRCCCVGGCVAGISGNRRQGQGRYGVRVDTCTSSQIAYARSGSHTDAVKLAYECVLVSSDLLLSDVRHGWLVGSFKPNLEDIHCFSHTNWNATSNNDSVNSSNA
ncbi:hypothetical protein M426DRAFT_22549 [Hypoxylon sp. CI-4A]|nr:hypothetical protein M426DRAFT_22549 [Hypoxylon sp. CI-4A]